MVEKVDLVLGLDLGTTNFKAALYTRDGDCAGIGRAAVELDSAANEESVLPADRFIANLHKCITLALKDADAAADNIRAVSYSSQTNSFLLLDKDNQPLTPLVIWNDNRAEIPEPEFQCLADHPEFLEQTGVGLFGTLSATAKILWYRKHRKDIWNRTKHIMTISDYLCFLLTGRNSGDSSTASMLGLWSVKQGRWWSPAFKLLDLDPGLFSDCVNPGSFIGKTSSSAEEKFSLPGDIPLTAGGQDHYMAAIGAGVGILADYSESTGTVLGLISLLSGFSPTENCVQGPGIHDDLPVYRMAFQDEGSVILNRFRKEYASTLSFSQLDSLAEDTFPGSGDVFALLKSENFSKENSFTGQVDDTSTGQYVRAIMEAIAASLKQMIDKTETSPSKILATGGGAGSDVWLQIKADMLNAEIISVDNEEPACAGAAILAAKAAGWVNSLKELPEGWVRIRKSFLPDRECVEYYREWIIRYKKII